MIYLLLIYEFFKTGLFSFGGGYATIPFLYNISETYGWFSLKELSEMTAISSITPGPIGINMATYAGLKTAGILGSAAATAAEVLPSMILVIILSKLLKKYSENFYVKAAISALKPIGCALLVSVTIGLLKPEIHNIKAILLLALLLLLSIKSKKEPVFYMGIAGAAGIISSLV